MTTFATPSGARHSPPDRHAVTMRPIQPGDAPLLYAMHERLSPESIYARYLQYRKPTLTELATICFLAAETNAGFVAVTQEPTAAIVGMAYYVRDRYEVEPTAEPGILVEDRFQAQGIGRRLWQMLQYHALLAGVHWLRIWTYPGNHRLVQLVRGGGFPYIAGVHAGLSEYRVALSKQPDYAEQRSDEPRVLFNCHWRLEDDPPVLN